LQEWGRERTDEAVIYKHVFKPLRYSATELTHLAVHDFSGLALDVRLLRHLYPEQRPLRHRIVREQERAIAKTARSFQRLFENVVEKDFHVRLRVQQTVDDTRCKQELRVDWPSQPKNVLKKLHEGWKKRYEESLLKKAVLKDVAIPEGVPGASPLLWSRSNEIKIALPSEPELAAVIVAAGATGKSTLLQRAAYNRCPDYRAFYIEQLPEELVDIQGELKEFVKTAIKNSAAALLIIDHLDRLIEDENAPFWLEQISAASKIKGLHIILASRTEEYNRYFRASLRDFQLLEWSRTKPLLVEGVIEPADSCGRLRAHAIESRCKGDRDSLLRIAALAKKMGQRRTIDLPDNMKEEWEGDFETSIGLQSIISAALSISGKTRFLHDCLQDFFSAVCIVHSFSDDAVNSSESDVLALRQLEHLPRDVVRFLFDLLASDNTNLFSQSVKRAAALRLAVAFIEEPTIQQWLYDTGRLQQARYAIDAYLKCYTEIDEVKLVTYKFTGHILYETYNPGDQNSHKNAEDAFSNWLMSIKCADLFLEKSNPKLATQYRWFVAFLVDHIFLVLTRFAGMGKDSSEKTKNLAKMQQLANDASVGTRPVAVGALEPGWIVSLLRNISTAKNQQEIDNLFRSIDVSLTKARQDGNRIHSLDVRRAHLASHLGNHFLGEGRAPSGKIPSGGVSTPDLERLNLAKEYFQQSISRRERVLREMERDSLNLRITEVFSTLCQGYADNAHQYRGVFECLFLSYKCGGDLADLAVELVQAHRLQEAKWAQARIYRGSSERLPNMFRTSLPWLATGRVLTELIESPADNPVEQDEVQKKLRKAVESLLNDYRQEGEVHGRFVADDTLGKSVFEDEVAHAATILKIAEAATEAFSGRKKLASTAP
jgi:GTPase SAR1 family protein